MFVCWLVDWLGSWLVSWLVGWLVVVVGYLVGWLFGWVSTSMFYVRLVWIVRLVCCVFVLSSVRPFFRLGVGCCFRLIA